MLFAKSAEEKDDRNQGCFLVLVFEKTTRKRTDAKTQTQMSRLKK